MKRLFKILAVILLLLLATILILPFAFEGKISEMAKKEINNTINATVDFSDMNLSLIRNFPNFSLGISNLVIVGKDNFQSDTLLFIEEAKVVIDLFSVISGDSYEVKSIILQSPAIAVKVQEDGLANYDIAKTDEEQPEEAESAGETAFHLTLKHFKILNGNLNYDDKQTGMTIQANGIYNSLSGDFTQDQTKLKNSSNIDGLSFHYGNINYLSEASISYDATIEADLKNGIYTLGKNELKINDLAIVFAGSVSTVTDGINLVLTFQAPNNRFKSMLSLVPAVYSKDFESVKADGNLSIDGNVKGIYTDNSLPAFNINVQVLNGMFSYPDLPGSVTDINLVTSISNPGGDADKSVIDVSQFSVKLGSNPFMATLRMKTPVSDPDIDAKIKGTLDLSTLKDYYPMEDELSGNFVSDITLRGKFSAIENEKYSEFVALGSVLVQKLNYSTSTFNKPVQISNAQLNFSPEYLDLVSFNLHIGNSDLNASGKIFNYLAYAFKNGVLKGQLNASSTYFNIDELLADQEESEIVAVGQSEDGEESPDEGSDVIEVPDRIDFTMNSSFEKLIYDSIEMDMVKGKVSIKNQVLSLDKLQMNVVKGLMIVTGNYSTIQPDQPEVDLKFKLNKLDIPSGYNHFAVMRTYLPVAKKTTGSFSADFNLRTKLDNKMMPVYETMNGGGNLNTTPLTVNDLNTFVQLANILNFTDLEKLELDKLNVSFKFINGKMMINPFDINYKNINAKIEGWTGFDQSIGYVMNMNIPREELGAGANQLMDNLINEANKLGGNFSLPETISFDVLIGGTLSKPTVKTGLADSGNDLIEKAKEEVIKEISKEAMQRAQQIIEEADRQAKAIIAEAEKQAKNLKENADEVVSDLKIEYNKQADSLVALGKKNGFVAELAAKEAARQLKAEADQQAQKLLNEADTQADYLINEAKKTAKRIKDEAQKQADALLKKD
jgi:vacuolar-type H+-ATPase subunit H